MKTKYYLIALVMGLTSCGPRNFFAEDATLVKKIPSETTLSATPIIMEEAYGFNEIVLSGDKIILTSTRLDKIFHVFDTNGNPIAQFGTKGRGPDELLDCGHTGKDLIFNDVNNRMLFELDLEESLANGKMVTVWRDKIPYMSTNFFQGRDSILFIEQMSSYNFEMVRHDLKTNDSQMETLYSEAVVNPFSYYQSKWRMHPERDVLVGIMYSHPQINFLSFENGAVAPPTRRAQMIGSRPAAYQEAVENDNLPTHSYYSDMAVTADKIYALCMDQSYEESYEIPKPVEIHEFNWEGRPLRKLRVDEYITLLAVTSDGRQLYGLDQLTETLYRYEIPERADFFDTNP